MILIKVLLVILPIVSGAPQFDFSSLANMKPGDMNSLFAGLASSGSSNPMGSMNIPGMDAIMSQLGVSMTTGPPSLLSLMSPPGTKASDVAVRVFTILSKSKEGKDIIKATQDMLTKQKLKSGDKEVKDAMTEMVGNTKKGVDYLNKLSVKFQSSFQTVMLVEQIRVLIPASPDTVTNTLKPAAQNNKSTTKKPAAAAATKATVKTG